MNTARPSSRDPFHAEALCLFATAIIHPGNRVWQPPKNTKRRKNRRKGQSFEQILIRDRIFILKGISIFSLRPGSKLLPGQNVFRL